MLSERLGNTELRVTLREQCAERDIWEYCARERDWRNTVLRVRLGEICAERKTAGKLC